MHGLILRAIQCFLRDIWGARFWAELAQDLRLPQAGFEAMLSYDPALADQVIASAAARLQRSRDSLLEDLGHYLVAHPRRDGVRRLLRFGGHTLTDFLLSLEDLPGRVRLAVPDLLLPDLRVIQPAPDGFVLTLQGNALFPGREVTMVLQGLLRAMADDYGALALIETAAEGGLHITVLDGAHAAARGFALAAAP